MGRVESPVESVAAGQVESPVEGVAAGQVESPAKAVGQPQMVGVGGPWSSGLFDCHLDQTNAVMTAFLPCVTFGQIAEVMNAGQMTCPVGSFIYMLMVPGICSQGIMGSKYRTMLRSRYGLVEVPYQDLISHIFCPCCSLCQEFRELKARGLNPDLGWNGIVAEQQAKQQQTNQPPSYQAMSK